MNLLLIRHGLTDDNAANVIQGHQPTPLNAVGLEQARALGEYLAGRRPRLQKLISSDLPRAFQTAQAIATACGREIEQDSCWRERCFGSLEGSVRPNDEIWRAAAGEIDPEGAEKSSDFKHRIAQAMKSVATRHIGDHTVAVVTHGGPCRMVLRLLGDGTLTLDPAQPPPELCTIANCSIMHLRCDEHLRWSVLRVNDVDHLAKRAVTLADAG